MGCWNWLLHFPRHGPHLPAVQTLPPRELTHARSPEIHLLRSLYLHRYGDSHCGYRRRDRQRRPRLLRKVDHMADDCEKCRFWRLIDSRLGYGICRRRAPQNGTNELTAAGIMNWFGKFPETNKTDWC